MAAGYNVAVPGEYYFDVVFEGYADNGLDTKPLFNVLYNSQNMK